MNLNRLIKIITDLLSRKDPGFYGKLTISFENGKIVNVKQEESLK
jgi:hypothetical protein